MCECCWRTQDEQGNSLILGTLSMPNRRLFLVCQDCVNAMWHERHGIRTEPRDENDEKY